MIGKFICLNEQTYNSEIPLELLGRYARVELDEEGVLVGVLPTTFAEVGEDNKTAYGSVVELNINDAKFYVMELEVSWLSGEITALIDLGEGLSYPNNTLLTREEAKSLIKANQDDLH